MLIDKYGTEYRKIIFNKRTYSYPYIYVNEGINKEDILAYIGIRIYMSLHKFPNYESYWYGKTLSNCTMSKLMSITKFLFLANGLHFPEKEEGNETDSTKESESITEKENNFKVDPRHKINLYLEKLAQNFQKYYECGTNITIDESLLHYKGRNRMKFYIPMKPYKHGFKIHFLCDSDTNYLYNMLFDPGRSGKDFMYLEDNNSLSESIVLRLVSCFNDNKQRNIFFDGWYSSISLMKKLSSMGYLNTTVLRAYSKELPSKIKTKEYDKAYQDEILIQKYEGKKTIFFATNYNIDKEELRNLYNIKSRAVDTFDHYLEISSIQRRTKKWFKKILLFGIDACIINAKILCELKTGKSFTTVQFKEKIVEHIFRIYNNYKNNKFNKSYNIKNDNNPNINNVNNYLKCSKNNKKSNNNMTSYRFNYDLHSIGNNVNNKRSCKFCQKKTNYICIECNIHIHPECFTEFHKKFVYK